MGPVTTSTRMLSSNNSQMHVYKQTASHLHIPARTTHPSIHLLHTCSTVGIETITDEQLETWSGKIGFKSQKVMQDYELYTSSLNKLRDMEQLFKEIEIRCESSPLQPPTCARATVL